MYKCIVLMWFNPTLCGGSQKHCRDEHSVLHNREVSQNMVTQRSLGSVSLMNVNESSPTILRFICMPALLLCASTTLSVRACSLEVKVSLRKILPPKSIITDSDITDQWTTKTTLTVDSSWCTNVSYTPIILPSDFSNWHARRIKIMFWFFTFSLFVIL